MTRFARVSQPLPGMTGYATKMLKQQIKDQDVLEISEFLTMLHDMGAHLWACKMSVDMMGLEDEGMIDEIEGVINVSTFVDVATDAQIIFV